MTKEISVTVSKETIELMDGLAKFVGAVKTALKDGWQPGSDLPVLLSSTITDLVPALDGIDKVKEELLKEKAAFVRALTIGSVKIYEEVTK